MSEIKNHTVFYKNLGLIPYQKGIDIQTATFDAIVRTKIKNRDLPINEKIITDNFLFFCEHPHVYTLGRSGKSSNLLISKEMLKDKNAEYYETGRGGDITYHGPGQLVGYPILDLDNFFTDIHKYLRFLEEAVIRTLQDFEIEAGRIAGLTGVWIDHVKQVQPRKICAFGVKTSRWVTMHGFSLNVNTDLSYFGHIVPCGIADKAVTSMAQELGTIVSMEEVSEKLLLHLVQLFEMDIQVDNKKSID